MWLDGAGARERLQKSASQADAVHLGRWSGIFATFAPVGRGRRTRAQPLLAGAQLLADVCPGAPEGLAGALLHGVELIRQLFADRRHLPLKVLVDLIAVDERGQTTGDDSDHESEHPSSSLRDASRLPAVVGHYSPGPLQMICRPPAVVLRAAGALQRFPRFPATAP